MVVFILLFAASVVGLGEAMIRLPRPSMASQALAGIVRSSDDAIFAKTLDAKILTWNVGAERMYGYTAAEVLGRPVAMLAPPERPDDVPRIMAQIVRGQAVDRYETVRIKKDGTRFDVSVTVSPSLARSHRSGTIWAGSSARRRSRETSRSAGAPSVHSACSSKPAISSRRRCPSKVCSGRLPPSSFPASRTGAPSISLTVPEISRT
jgi:PAS domain S-box-containing protein